MSAFVLDDFVALLRRTTDPGWLDPILADADSAAVLTALMTEFVAMSAAADLACMAGAISTAPGGRPGTGVLTVQRTASGTSGTVPKGYLFADERGIQMATMSDVPVSSMATTLVLPVQTLRQTELVNTPDDAAGVVIDPLSPIVLDSSALTVLIAPPGSSGIVSTTFTSVASASQILNGVVDYLSLHGDERGQLRQAFELEEPYRLRVRNIPDAISPEAVSQGVQGAASQVGLDGTIIREPFEDSATPALKEAMGLGSFDTYYMSGLDDPATSPKTDFVDDPFFGPPSPLPAGFVLRSRETVSRREARAYFRVETPSVVNDPDGLRFFCDSSFCDDPVWGYLDVHDHPTVIASLMAIWEEANRKRAAGVQFDVLLPLAQEQVASGHAVAGASVLVTTQTPPVGKSWILVDFVAGHDAARSGTVPDPTTDFHRIRFTFTDATIFQPQDFSGTTSEHLTVTRLSAIGYPLGKRISKIEGFVGGAGILDLGLVVDARVLEFTE